jgi:hypothetical protein
LTSQSFLSTDGSTNFGTSGLQVSGFWSTRLSHSLSGLLASGSQSTRLSTPCHSNSRILKFRFTLLFGPTIHLSPLIMMAYSTFRKVHITFSDVIRSHHSRLSSRLTGTWCTPMCPHPFQGNPTVRLLSDLWHRSFRRFGVSTSGVRASPHLELLFAEIMKLRSILRLDPMVTYNLWCRSFRNFVYRNFLIPVHSKGFLNLAHVFQV